MSNVKNGAFREIIIDRCLQSRRGYSIKEIMEKCNDALECRCEPLVLATNTIRNDILSIENRWHIVVEPVKSGRNIRYRYENPNFSIFNSPLNEDEIVQLNQAVSLLRRFEGMPSFEWVDELNVHLQTMVSVRKKSIIGFDENKQLRGMNFFTPLFEYISKEQVIEVKYQTYKDDVPKVYIIHPYYLKEFNQRWFLFGLNAEFQRITTFALDRIKALKFVPEKFIENKEVDFEHYFDNIIGVSSGKDNASSVIVFHVCAEQLPYMLTKPLHSTQEVYEHLPDGSAILTINVKSNFELIQSFLSFGDRVTVLEPKSLRAEIKARIERNLKNYQ